MADLGEQSGTILLRFRRSARPSFRINWAARTDTGFRRERNEDSYLAKYPVFAVADGMGGHAAGDVASAMVVKRLAQLTSERGVSASSLERALKKAANDMGAILATEGRAGGTTVTGVALTMVSHIPHWLAFNIGDSRVYGWGKGRLRQITVDHSLVEYMVQTGQLSRHEAENHPDSNIITRAVGYKADTTPDYWLMPIQPGMKVLVCSDGLTKEISDEQIEACLAMSDDPDEVVDAIIRAALEHGGRDNVTAIVLTVEDEDTE